MGLKGKVERLRSRLPAKSEPQTLAWIHPETGEIIYELTVMPTPDGRGYTVSEYWSTTPEDGATVPDTNGHEAKVRGRPGHTG